MGVKKKIKNLSRKNYILKKIVEKSVLLKRKIQYQKISKNVNMDDKLIFFESFFARKYECSPKAIYEFMKDNPEYSDFKFIWAFKNPDCMARYFENENVKLVKPNSREYMIAFAKAKYWVRNTRVPQYIVKKHEQVYIQCWHGTPLKRIGCDIKVKGNNPLSSNKTVRRQYRQDASNYTYMISPSRYCSERFVSAFDLNSFGKSNAIVETGYPRNDELFHYDYEKVNLIKTNINIPLDKKVLLYAPTFRDNQHKLGVGFTYNLNLDLNEMREKLQNQYVILLRLHYHVANKIDLTDFKGFAFDVSKYDDINDLYAVSDILITDYSSVFFDYANLKRPIIFYMYDLEEYKNISRDFYFDLQELPGPIVKKEKDLLDMIDKIDILEEKYKSKYMQFNKKFNYLDDGYASKRVVERCIK